MVTAHSDSQATSLANGFVFGITSGLGLPIWGRLSFDAELVTLIDTSNRVVNIVIHPGLLVGLPWGLTVGARGAWETSGAFGFTPVLNKGFPVGNNALYVEAAVPVRFKAADQGFTSSTTFAVHVGVGF